MFFTECARLAERHPNLAAAVEKIDAQLRQMRTAEIIRVGDLASFLRLDQNQASAVLEGLAEAGFLCPEEMVECIHCGMAVLRSDYDEALEEEDEYRCTSCDRRWEDRKVRAVTTYRRGDKWPELPPEPVADRVAEPFIGPAEAYPKDTRIFKNQGKTWLVVYDGVPRSVEHSVGMAYIARLLQAPGTETHAAALRSTVSADGNVPVLGSAGDVLDACALKEYRSKMTELQEEIQEAENNNDLGRVQKLKEDLHAITEEVGRATGLGGRNRKAADDRERARKTTSVGIRRALKAIKKEHQPLWQHLKNSLKIGEFLTYQPDQPTSWST
ncbi:MAG: hypothetical protein HYU36_08790 [Planctomycetes bacterium]|nr:hypothetical protein [Planctomycetota bacterium]